MNDLKASIEASVQRYLGSLSSNEDNVDIEMEIDPKLEEDIISTSLQQLVHWFDSSSTVASSAPTNPQKDGTFASPNACGKTQIDELSDFQETEICLGLDLVI
jgi:hypothetical protein